MANKINMEVIKLKHDFSNLEEFESAMNEEQKIIWDVFQNECANGLSYENLTKWQNMLEPYKISFDYYLNAEPYNFKLTSIKLSKCN